MRQWKSYLWWTIAAIAGLHLLYFGLLTGMRLRDTGEYGKINALANADSTYQLVILGSSRAETGVIPSLLTDTPSEAFNFGFVGASVPFQEVVLETLLAKDAKPETVILCLDLYNLVEKSPVMYSNKFLAACTNPIFRKGFFQLETSLQRQYYLAPYGLMRLQDAEVYAGLRGYLGWETDFDRAHHRGYVPVPTDRNTKWMTTFPDSIPVEADSTILKSLDRIAQRCADEGVQLIVVAPPLHPAYKSRLHGLPEMQKRIARLAAAWHLPYLDLTDDPAFDDPTIFMDHSHVNAHGAQALSWCIGYLLTQRQ